MPSRGHPPTPSRSRPPTLGCAVTSPPLPQASCRTIPRPLEGVAVREEAERPDAGTGYGDRRVEHATRVAFDSESRAGQQVFLKYEWRETLCTKRILSCEDPPNRFWPERSTDSHRRRRGVDPEGIAMSDPLPIPLRGCCSRAG